MRAFRTALASAAAIAALAAPAPAQEAAAEQGAPAAQPAAPPELPGSRADAQPRQPYSVGTFSAWEVRCIRVDEAPNDPCEMGQTLLSEDGSPTAEVNIFRLQRQGVEAGGTIVTPLETLLTRNITLSVDGAEAKHYPFTFCNRQGCVSQVAFTPAEVAAFKKGSNATVTIYPVAAPDQPVALKLSLSGFTSAYDSLTGVPGIP